MLKKQYKILILIDIGAILDNHLAIFFYLFIWYLSFFKHIIIIIHTCWFWIYVLPKYMPIYESYINLILCISMELCYYVLDVSCLSSVDQESLKWWKKNSFCSYFSYDSGLQYNFHWLLIDKEQLRFDLENVGHLMN